MAVVRRLLGWEGSAWPLLTCLIVAAAGSALLGQQGQGLVSACGFPRGSCSPHTPGTGGQFLAPAHGSCSGGGDLCPAPVGSVLLPENSRRERSSYGGPAPLLVHPPVMAACLSGVPRLLLCTPSVATVQPLQAVSAQPTPVLPPGSGL